MYDDACDERQRFNDLCYDLELRAYVSVGRLFYSYCVKDVEFLRYDE